MLTQQQLKEVLLYDPETGLFKWAKNRHRVNKGDIAGSLAYGYVSIKLYGEKYMAHRLAFLYITGKWPKEEVDHINCTRNDNRWINLREATRFENMRNVEMKFTNKTGFKGVSKSNNKWLARIRVLGKFIHLGVFNTPEEANEAYIHAANKHFGEFSNGG